MPDDAGLFADLLATLAWVTFVASLFLSSLLGAILAYHWFRYAMNLAIPTLALLVYGSGAFLFLSAMFTAALFL